MITRELALGAGRSDRVLHRFARATSLSLLAALAALPFLYPVHSRPLTTFYVEWLAFVFALVFVATTLAWSREPAPQASFWIGAFAAYIALQALWLPYWERVAIGAAYPALAALVLWAAAALRHAPGARVWLLRALAAGAFLMALTGFSEYFEVPLIYGRMVVERPAGFGMSGALGQRNMFAAYLGCGFAALLALRVHWSITILAGAAIAIAEAYSGARAAWLFMGVAGIVALGDRRATAVWAACFAIFIAVRLGPAAAAVNRDAVGVIGSAREAVGSRWALLSLAWRVWLEHPAFGAGFGEFAHASYQVLRPGDPAGIERHAHNVIAQLMAETGIAGTGILSAGVLAWARCVAWGTILRDAGARGLAAVLLIVGIYSCTEFPLWHAQFLVLTAAVMGLMMRGWK